VTVSATRLLLRGLGVGLLDVLGHGAQRAEALFDGADDLPAIPAGALIVEDRVQPVRVAAGDGDRDVRQFVL
jgi:hypothetical protein